VIRNVVIHISNEQPLLADLYAIPSPADVGLVCTNVRTMDGKRPIFIDHTDSTFFFPNLHIRFLEILATEMQRHLAQGGNTQAFAPGETVRAGPEQYLPVLVDEGSGPEIVDEPDLAADADMDIDEDFLQRIRDI
jgi:hypothetical protein